MLGQRYAFDLIRFDPRYEVWRDGGWQRIEEDIPTNEERIRSVSGRSTEAATLPPWWPNHRARYRDRVDPSAVRAVVRRPGEDEDPVGEDREHLIRAFRALDMRDMPSILLP